MIFKISTLCWILTPIRKMIETVPTTIIILETLGLVILFYLMSFHHKSAKFFQSKLRRTEIAYRSIESRLENTQNEVINLQKELINERNELNEYLRMFTSNNSNKYLKKLRELIEHNNKFKEDIRKGIQKTQDECIVCIESKLCSVLPCCKKSICWNCISQLEQNNCVHCRKKLKYNQLITVHK